MKVLLMVPDVDERRLLMQGLQQVGITVQALAFGAPFEPSAKADPATFIILACAAEQGVEASQQIRRHTAAPLLVIATVRSETERQAIYRAGADLIFVRPYSLRLLLLEVGIMAHRAQRMVWAHPLASPQPLRPPVAFPPPVLK